ncbi:hypothetical protein N7490_010405 [Penicillium lividum]|nr:hypothetical protein N7490_010405 [Penicillium lividum]
MATIQHKSELMTNNLSVVTVPPASHIATCWDPQTSQPIVFALSNDKHPKLQMIHTDSNGHRVKTDIEEFSRLPDENFIQAFDVQQSSDFTIFLSVATKLDENSSNLWVAQPFQCTDLLKITFLHPQTVGRVSEIWIGLPESANKLHPSIWVEYRPLVNTTKGSDIGRVDVNPKTGHITIWKDMTLPVNAARILDIAPASGGSLGDGLFFLFEVDGLQYLQLKLVRPGNSEGEVGRWSQFDMICPPGATAIGSFTDFSLSSRKSALLVGSPKGLHLFPASEITKNLSSTIVTENPMFLDVRDLYVAQHQSYISVWTRNRQDELGYIYAPFDDLSNGQIKALLPAGKATSFAPLILSAAAAVYKTDAKQMLIANDEHGNLTLLIQSLDTGNWREESFYVEQGGNKIELESYNVNLTCLGTDKMPLSNGKIFISAHSSLAVVIRGHHETLERQGSWFDLGVMGNLTLLIPKGGATSLRFQVTKLQDASATAIPLGVVDIDPAPKKLTRPPASGADWMGALDDKLSLSRLTIPGTHDSRCADGLVKLGFATFAGDFVYTQKKDFDIPAQLNAGIRFLDFRVAHKGQLRHGSAELNATLYNEVYHVAKFLKKHPTEAVFISVKWELEEINIINRSSDPVGEPDGEAQRIVSLLMTIPDAKWWMQPTIPTIGECRGSMVLLSRFKKDIPQGIRYTPGERSPAGALAAYAGQDHYDLSDLYDSDKPESGLQEMARVKFHEKAEPLLLEALSSLVDNTLYFNFMSGYATKGLRNITPKRLADRVNGKLKEYLEFHTFDVARLGLIVMDFADSNLARQIWTVNFNNTFTVSPF